MNTIAIDGTLRQCLPISRRLAKVGNPHSMILITDTGAYLLSTEAHELTGLTKTEQPVYGAGPAKLNPETGAVREPYERGYTENREWRRFELCFTPGPTQDALYQLLDRLDLSRRELALIVLGLRVRPGFDLQDFDT